MKSLLTIFRFVWPYFKKLRAMFFCFLITAALFMLISMTAQTYMIGQFLDGLTGGTLTSDHVFLYCGAFLGVAVCNVLLSYATKLLAQRVGVRGYTDMAQQIYRHLQKASPRCLSGKNVAELVGRIYNDSSSMVLYLVNMGIMGPGMALTFALTLIYIFYLDVWCGLITFAIVPLMSLMNKLMGKKLTEVSRDKAKARDRYISSLDEQLRPVRSIRLNSLFEVMSNRYVRQAKILEEAYIKNEKVFFPYDMIQRNLNAIITVALMVYASIAILQGQMTVGQFVIIHSYVSVVASCLSYLMSINEDAHQFMAYYTRLKELSEIPEEGNGGEFPSPLECIAADALDFSYQEGVSVLENFSQSFERGKIYCLVGRNGSGKSTLTDILLGLYVSDGDVSVKYNGIPLQSIDLYRMRAKRIGVSEQEPMVLNGSIGFNITYLEDSNGDLEVLRELLEMVDFKKGELDWHDPEALLQLNAGELSGGQKQKVSIVKALYKKPELLVLDEPTSALDVESRKRLANYLKGHAQERITILVSHDQELIDIADEVVYLGEEKVTVEL